MNAQRWQRVKEILADAREQPRRRRQSWLQQACGEDPGLLREVEEFLALEDQLPGFIEEPILPMTVDLLSPGEQRSEDPAGEEPGRRIGPYRLVQRIATGGMGTVYLAERDEEFEQRVALKLVRHGSTLQRLTQRFHHERQILARLEHPNIARLLDGGTTQDGSPYFAMEWIQGVPIDRYCEEQNLSPRQRLELLLPICSALALAHRNLVVHRDLKPANILVDTTGTPKLLDFGIAKILDLERPLDSPAGLAHHSALTPRYASPEQLRGETISTASDVYSLGVVLHLLLTGDLPPPAADLPGLDTATVPEGDLRAGIQSEPAPAKPGSALDGDLRAILGQALRRDPQERYASIEHLAADLRRYLQGFPVRARQGGYLYRTGKFLRRHRLGVANGALVLILVVAFSIALLQQFQETARSRDQAEEIAAFLVDLFRKAVPDQPAGKEPTVRDLLDAGREKLQESSGQEPGVRATLLLRLGEVYNDLGDYGEARALFEEAVELLRRPRAAPTPALATALNDLATVLKATGDPQTAERLYRESLALRRDIGDEENAIKPMNNLATILVERGEYREAEAIYRQTLEMRRALLAASPDDPFVRPNLATSLRSLATALQGVGDLDAAEPLLRESLELRRELYGPDSASVATAELSLGRLELARGRLPEAEGWMARGLETRIRELGPDHLHTALARRDLAKLRLAQGRKAEALVLLHQALETITPMRPDGDPEVVEIRNLQVAAQAPAPSAAPP